MIYKKLKNIKKIKSILKVKHNVEITDVVNNNILFSNEARYLINENKIISRGDTVVKIDEKYLKKIIQMI